MTKIQYLNASSVPTLVYQVPSTTFFYVPGSSKVYQTYHAKNQTWGIKADSKRGRYLVGLLATKGALAFFNKD